MKKIPRPVWIAVGLAAAAAAIYFASLPSPVPVRTAPVERGLANSYVEERAVTSLPSISKITMPFQGRVLPITKDDGTPVKKGELVAHLDPVDLDNWLEQSEQITEFMRQSVLASDATIKSSQDHLYYAEWWVNAQKAMYEKQTIAEKGLREAILDYQASLDTHNRAVREGKSTSAILSLANLFQIYMNRQVRLAKLESPVDGIVLKRYYSNPLVLDAGTLLLEIGDLSALQITADILTTEAADIRPGNRVDILDFPPGQLRGTVSHIKHMGFTKTSSLGIEEQRIPVEIQFGEGELAALNKAGVPLGVAWRARVRIFTAEKSDALTIPATALVRNPDGGWSVFVVEGGKARSRKIRTGLTNPDRVEVLDGLPEAANVILAPPATLQDGAPVSLEAA